MKKLIIILLTLFSTSAFAGDKVSLSKVEPLSVPTATKMEVANIIINLDTEKIFVVYRWLDSDGNKIVLYNGAELAWECSGQCFQDTYGYLLKNGDSGNGIGLTLRDLLWSEMSSGVISGGNSGDFDKKKVK